MSQRMPADSSSSFNPHEANALPALQRWMQEWRRYTRLNLERLEDRLPPGSMLGMFTPLFVDDAMPVVDPVPPSEPAPSMMLATTPVPPEAYNPEPLLLLMLPPTDYNAYVVMESTPSVPENEAPAEEEAADLAFVAGFYAEEDAFASNTVSTEYDFTLSMPEFPVDSPSTQPVPATSYPVSYDPMTNGVPESYSPWDYYLSDYTLGGESVVSGDSPTGPDPMSGMYPESDIGQVEPQFVTYDGVLDRSGTPRSVHTNDSTPTLFGTGTPGADLVVMVSSATTYRSEIYTTTVQADGTWNATLDKTQSDGWRVVDIELRKDGVAQAFTAANFVIDTLAPTVSLSVENQYVVGRDPTFQININDGENQYGSFNLTFDIDRNKDGDYADEQELAQVEITSAGPYFSYTWTDFDEGNPNVRVRVTDAAGNEGTSAEVEIFTAFVDNEETFDGDYSNDPEYWNSLNGQQFFLKPEILAFGLPGEIANGEVGNGEVGVGGAPAPGVVMADSFLTETEPNDTTGQANAAPVANGQRTFITGSIATTTDIDIFSFTLAARSGVFFDIDSRETGLSTTLNTQITILDAGGTAVTNGTNDNGYDFDTGLPAQGALASATTADSSLYLDLPAGNYFARVSSVGNTTGNYQFIIRPDSNYLSAPPALSSLPGAAKTLYLDFDGHTLPASDPWVTSQGAPTTAVAYDINGNAAEFTPAEQLAIQNIWRVVSEDYSPFAINVTTVAPTTFDNNVMRMLMTNNDGAWVGVGGILGVAFGGSFASTSPSDNLAWVFTANFDQSFSGGNSGQLTATALEIGNTASHEAGHTFGLRHYGGGNAGTNTNGIMFTPDSGLNREIWRSGPTHDGEGTVQAQDDMAIISNVANGIGYRTDDHGNTQATATTLTVAGLNYTASGVIADIATDVDWFSFRGPATPGVVTLGAYVNDYLNDLRPTLTVRDAAGNVIATVTGAATGTPNFDAVTTATLGDQDYYVTVASSGVAGEAGQYDLVITLPTPPTPPVPPTPPGPPAPPTPPTTGLNLPGDFFEDNDTSEVATALGALGSTIQGFTALTLNVKPDGLNDYDWFRWTAAASGTVTITTTTTLGGDIEVTLYRLDGNTLVELGHDRTIGGTSRLVTGAISAGQSILVQVKGRNSAPGIMDEAVYNLGARIV